MSYRWSYNTEDQANEVLEFYEGILLRCKYISFIAIVKDDSSNGYALQIGISKKGVGLVKINKKISAVKAYFGKFEPNEIPGFFPIPTDFYYRIEDFVKKKPEFKVDFNKDNIPDEFGNEFLKGISVNEELIVVDFNSNLPVISSFNVPQNLQEDNISAKTTQSEDQGFFIKSVHGQVGSLGGAFKLLQFPDFLFGITNDHIFSGLPAQRGTDVVIDGTQNIIGKLFWKSFDRHKEVAIIQFEETFADEIVKNRIKIDKDWRIEDPEIDMGVIHNGFASSKLTHGVIHSLNATVRIYYTHINANKVFKNQLLIKSTKKINGKVIPFTTYGDSGALVFDKSSNYKKTIGLNFSLTSSNAEYSVANNLNNIFNIQFRQKQEILASMDNEQGFRPTVTLTSSFKLNN